MKPSMPACVSVLMLACGAILHLVATAPAAITLRTSPLRFGAAPCPVTVWVTAEPTEADSQIDVALDGGAFYRSSSWSIPGEFAAKTYEVSWRDVPAGTYLVSASIGNARRIRARVSRELEIIGP